MTIQVPTIMLIIRAPQTISMEIIIITMVAMEVGQTFKIATIDRPLKLCKNLLSQFSMRTLKSTRITISKASHKKIIMIHLPRLTLIKEKRQCRELKRIQEAID